jgi:type II secretory pathway pseudopilin PulG
MSRNNKHRRGYTLVELLSIVVVLGLVMTLVATVIGPLLRSQNQTQAKVDTVQAAAMALYRLERDLRNSQLTAIYACTTAGTPSCTQPTALTATPAIVVATAYQLGTGQFQFDQSTGKPEWQGATVYWVDASGNLKVAFVSNASLGIVGNGNPVSATQAGLAVTNAFSSQGLTIARFVEQMSLQFPTNENVVSLELQAQSTVSGALNETTYQTDVEPRND